MAVTVDPALEELVRAIVRPEPALVREARAALDAKTKPRGSLGRLENLAVRIAAIRGTTTPARLDPVVVVAAASTTPAALLGLGDRGALATGLRADVLSLTDDWRVDRVMRGGAWVG